MKPEEAEKLIDQLSKKLQFHNEEYYQKGENSIDDNTFDVMLEQLIELESRYPQFVRVDSPSQRVGGEPTTAFQNIAHEIPMLSLANAYTREEIQSWYQTILKRTELDAVDLVCEVKIDGVAISVVYEKGFFKQAVTRGNGIVGDDVSHNVKTIRSLPLRLDQPATMTLRGEIYLPIGRFKQLNQIRQQEGVSPFKNPRNAAAGTVRMKDPKTVSQRGLEMLVYDIVKGQQCDSHRLNLKMVEDLKIPVNSYRKSCRSLKEVIEFCCVFDPNKSDLPFEIDGVVIKINSLELREKLGMTMKSPRWAIAWKFKATKAKSRLLGIENSIGRTGVLTPIANLEPVQLLGTEVKRATLHNYDHIEKLGIYEKDVLFVEKGGDIIPKIVGVDYVQRQESAVPLAPPDRCPQCAKPLFRKPPDIDLRCANGQCPAIVRGAMEHFISKKGMDIQFLGTAFVNQLIDQGYIRSIPDLYRLHESKNRLMEMEGFGEKSVENLLSAIETSKSIPLNRFIYSLGIRHIGEKAAKIIFREVETIDRFVQLKMEDLDHLPDFGPVMKHSLMEWLGNQEHMAMIDELKKLGLQPKSSDKPKTKEFGGQKIVITGKLSRSRLEWKNWLESVGFWVVSSVSKKTDYLLVGADPGSKLAKAQKFRVRIISEQEMEKLLIS